MVEVGSNLFQFKFTTKFDMERVLRDGPWTFDNQILMLRKWQPGMTATNVKFDSVALWVQIWGAPFDMVYPQVATAMGRQLGVVEEVEQRRRKDMQNMFMRVKVAIPITKPLRRGDFYPVQMDREFGLRSSMKDCLCFAIFVDCWVMISSIVLVTLLL